MWRRSMFDTWDMKTGGTAEYRGPFQTDLDFSAPLCSVCGAFGLCFAKQANQTFGGDRSVVQR